MTDDSFDVYTYDCKKRYLIKVPRGTVYNILGHDHRRTSLDTWRVIDWLVDNGPYASREWLLSANRRVDRNGSLFLDGPDE